MKRKIRVRATLSDNHPKVRVIVPDRALRKLVENGRDYSGGTNTFRSASSMKCGMTKNQKEQFDWQHRPHIIYTPMGGQNKKY